MATEHNVITDPNRHEPKGIISAATGRVYVANGGGVDGGAWKDVLPVGTSVAEEGQLFEADGAGGGAWHHHGNIHGDMQIIDNTISLALPLPVDSTLNTDSDYRKLSTNWTTGHLQSVNFNVDSLVVTVAGYYEIKMWMSLEVSTINALVALKYFVNDAKTSQRKALNKAKVASDISNLSSNGFETLLNVGDTISIYLASTVATDIIAKEAGLTLTMIEEA